ncbi:MAG: OmpA family protein [Alphaproteobacteria bacterium]
MINDTVAMAEPAPAAPPPDVEAPQGKPKFYTIFFDWDKSDITPLAQQVVNSILTDWETDPEALNLIGHADRSGPDSYNQQLSRQRVDSVTGALSAGGIKGSRLSGTAKGESEPLVPTPDGVREQQNRRVVIIVK